MGFKCPHAEGLILTPRVHKENKIRHQTAQTALDHWPNIAIVIGKQAARKQSNPETYLDLWCTTVGISVKF